MQNLKTGVAPTQPLPHGPEIEGSMGHGTRVACSTLIHPCLLGAVRQGGRRVGGMAAERLACRAHNDTNIGRAREPVNPFYLLRLNKIFCVLIS